MELVHISHKIRSVAVVPRANQSQPAGVAGAATPGSESGRPTGATVVQMHEAVERPGVLDGRTYRIKGPTSDHALYVTINHLVLNPGTPHEIKRPFEIFLSTKDATIVQWTLLVSRIMSAVFRKGGDVMFLIGELRSIYDPRGGYFKPGGDWRPSLISEIGDVIEEHLEHIGLLVKAKPQEDSVKTAEKPVQMSQCGKCSKFAVTHQEGCEVCTNCGYSKCG